MNLSLIAPASGAVPPALSAWRSTHHESAIADIQRFRGRIYVHDEALPLSALDSSGRHCSDLDYQSWHIVARDAEGHICGVMRMPIYPIDTPIESLLLHKTLERMEPDRRRLYTYTAQRFIDRSTARGYTHLCEAGGWAVDKHRCDRNTGLSLAAASWMLLRCFGQGICLSTVTVKHHAADLLKRMGGFNELEGTPHARFHDPFFRCDIELVFFHADIINPAFEEPLGNARRVLLGEVGVSTLQ